MKKVGAVEPEVLISTFGVTLARSETFCAPSAWRSVAENWVTDWGTSVWMPVTARPLMRITSMSVGGLARAPPCPSPVSSAEPSEDCSSADGGVACAHTAIGPTTHAATSRSSGRKSARGRLETALLRAGVGPELDTNSAFSSARQRRGTAPRRGFCTNSDAESTTPDGGFSRSTQARKSRSDLKISPDLCDAVAQMKANSRRDLRSLAALAAVLGAAAPGARARSDASGWTPALAALADHAGASAAGAAPALAAPSGAAPLLVAAGMQATAATPEPPELAPRAPEVETRDET